MIGFVIGFAYTITKLGAAMPRKPRGLDLTPAAPPSAPLAAPPDLTGASHLADLSDPWTASQPPPLAVREVLDFPAVLMAQLPAPWSLYLLGHGPEKLLITTHRETYSLARASGVVALSGAWIYPMALAAEHGRGTWQTLGEWLSQLANAPNWTLTAEYALGHIYGRYTSPVWAMYSVLHKYDLQLANAVTHL